MRAAPSPIQPDGTDADPERGAPASASPQPCTPWVVAPVPSRHLVAAADALVGAPVAGAPRAGRRFLEAARAQGMDLSCFWCTTDRDRDRVRHACALVPGAGRTAMLFCSAPGRLGDATEVASLVDAACASREGPELVQALLETGTPTLESALLGAGFTRIGALQYLRRPWREAPTADDAGWPSGIEVRPWRDGDDPALAEALEASYEATQDCPELHGMRRTQDVIESHRSTGRWDPRLWWLVLDAGAARGALLLNPCPDHGNTELVYLGLAPSLRGRGLAGRVLTMGLAALAARKHRTVACAVDARNAPARKLYESFGFRLFAERIAFVREAAPAR